jgi:Protein of unknown function (DUF3052)
VNVKRGTLVIATAHAAATNGSVAKLGFAAGQVVQEFGYDQDVDDDFRLAIEEVCGSELEEEDYGDVADAVVLWWREDDGDLVDALVDGLTNLAEGGFIVLLTPKAGRSGHVDASDIQEATLTAGLHSSGNTNAAREWGINRLVAPKTDRR